MRLASATSRFLRPAIGILFHYCDNITYLQQGVKYYLAISTRGRSRSSSTLYISNVSMGMSINHVSRNRAYFPISVMENSPRIPMCLNPYPRLNSNRLVRVVVWSVMSSRWGLCRSRCRLGWWVCMNRAAHQGKSHCKQNCLNHFSSSFFYFF